MVTLAIFYKLESADLLKCRLEAFGIPAFLSDDATAQMNWLYTNAIGGVGVQVADEDYEAAKEVLDAEPVPIPESFADSGVDDSAVTPSHSLFFRVVRSLFYGFVLLFFLGPFAIVIPLVLWGSHLHRTKSHA